MERVPLAGGLIDRDAATRGSLEALDAAWASPKTLVLRVHGTRLPVARTRDTESRETGLPQSDPGSLDGISGPAKTLAFVSPSSLDVPAGERVYLGLWDGTPVFAVAVADEAADPATVWLTAMEVLPDLDEAERELVTASLAVLRWHESAGFSPRDGAPTEVADGGWSRRTATGGELFPRTDPAVIALIEHEGRVLLGSNALWEIGRFSLLAGFVEAGETLEQAVAREVFEESGVRVADIRYVASQPWPFPRSLMLGFRVSLAQGQDPDALLPDPAEISELRWFTREEIRSPQPGVRLPGTLSIAGWLLHAWAKEDSQ